MGVNTYTVAINGRGCESCCVYLSLVPSMMQMSPILCVIRFALSDAFCSVLCILMYMYTHVCPD